MVIGDGKSTTNCRSLIIRNDWAIVNYRLLSREGCKPRLFVPLSIPSSKTEEAAHSRLSFLFAHSTATFFVSNLHARYDGHGNCCRRETFSKPLMSVFFFNYNDRGIISIRDKLVMK